jgi:DNA-binding MarR family transcriptional regulator
LEAVPISITQSASSSDIADDLREETHWIASTLKALEKKGMIVCTKRGGLGLPSHWRTTDAGRAALQSTTADSKEKE